MKFLCEDSSLPDSCFLLDDVREKYSNESILIQPQLFRDLHDLRFTLKQRLIFAEKIIHKHKKNLKEFFSKSDLNILSILLASQQIPNSSFVEQLLSSNTVLYKDQPSKNLNKLINFASLDLYDRKPQKYLTRWMCFSLDKIKNQKILDTIKAGELYTVFPENFNDIFDAQLRCSDNIIRNLADKYVSVKFGKNVSLEEISSVKFKFIEYYQSLFNSSTISCFSRNDPINVDSHSMWGLYGGAGAGFVLQYDLDELEKFLLNQNTELQNFLKGGRRFFSGENESAYNSCRILPVSYKKNSPLDFFDLYLKETDKKIRTGQRDQEKISKILSDFYSIKNLNWQYEQEIRFIFLCFSAEAGFNNTDHILTLETYMRSDNPLEKLKEAKKQFYAERKNIMPFIKPSRIILGWNYLLNDLNLYNELINFAKSNNIEIGYLRDTVDYVKGEFEFCKI